MTNESFAGNIKDTNFYFSFSPVNSYITYTESRTKYDKTSAYMKLESINDGVNGYGAEVVDGNNRYFNKRFPLVYFTEYTINEGQYIKNYAGEERGTPVNVKIKAKGGAKPGSPNATWRANGKWSPDSI